MIQTERTPYNAETVPLSDEAKDEATRVWENLEAEFCKVIELIKPDIESGRWSGVIADDSRARFPALVIREVISRYYSEQSLGRKVPLTYLAGTRFIDTEEDSDKLKTHQEYLARLQKADPNGRKLIITDQIEEGTTMANAIDLLSEAGIKFDALSLYTSYPYGPPEPTLENRLEAYDPTAKFYHLDSKWESGSIVEGLSTLRYGLGEQGLDWYWPLGKSRNLDTVEGQEIPVAIAKRSTDEYKLLRQLCREMAQKVYGDVFERTTTDNQTA